MSKWKAGDIAVEGGKPRPERPTKMHCPKGHEYSEENTKWRWASSHQGRCFYWDFHCLDCGRSAWRSYRTAQISKNPSWEKERHQRQVELNPNFHADEYARRVAANPRLNIENYEKYGGYLRQQKYVETMPPLQYAKRLLMGRRRKALKRMVVRHAREEGI